MRILLQIVVSVVFFTAVSLSAHEAALLVFKITVDGQGNVAAIGIDSNDGKASNRYIYAADTTRVSSYYPLAPGRGAVGDDPVFFIAEVQQKSQKITIAYSSRVEVPVVLLTDGNKRVISKLSGFGFLNLDLSEVLHERADP